MRGASSRCRSSDRNRREVARREITLRERVSSREMFVLGSVLGPAKADAGRRQEPEVVLRDHIQGCRWIGKDQSESIPRC
jgi:hypothetical protein